MNARQPAAVSRAVDRLDLVREASALLDAGRRLAMIACHDDDGMFRIVYLFAGEPGAGDTGAGDSGGTGTARRGPVELVVAVPADDAWVPSLAALSFPAGQFEREMFDLYGVLPRDHPLPHRLLRHAHWPHSWHPMRNDARVIPPFAPDTAAYPFVEVEGAGVYEVAVGPVHAGIIEPGHFRFSVVGETIVRMETRLWFLHRGVEKLFEGRRPEDAIALAEQITGDTSVGHSLAFVMAVETAAGVEVPDDDRLVRALLLELERMHNHVTDLGALANDAAFGIANIHAQRIRERLMRLDRAVAGHRLLRGCLSIGGARLRSLPDPAALLAIAHEVAELVEITLTHPVVLDRFSGTSQLHAEQARGVGTLGYVARASGVDVDARRELPFAELGDSFEVVVETGGDVLARYLVRAREFGVSARVCADLIARLGGSTGRGAALRPAAAGTGAAFVEAWRGTLVHRVELASDGRLARVKIVDPSFLNWPALPIALADTIVPDFPLTNKSFNQSYAGNDL
ncbi:nickel-dependent hydrogenase large subunit [Agromyces bauzanensis]|uniref:Formate hydrogenase n=1 Tax=Agromyces bauzanensis TaxID=1308924 RepID=A0A917UUH1_9MICO|nr:nickel-dependent hydrogenase large subunit [Agromyces bauzanensis]GGJ86898.1 formate hydrogenase [Agromyces bauzanensis]